MLGFADAQVNRYMVFFKDKANTPYTIQNPEAFLSPKAISRRTAQQISITEEDLPVNVAYIDDVKATGAEVFYQTKWLNGILIQCDEGVIPNIENLSFVKEVRFVAPNAKLQTARKSQPKFPEITQHVLAENSTLQLSMLGLDQLHALGYEGNDMLIGVFDAGYIGVNSTAPFAHINPIWEFDYVSNTANVYQYHTHGTSVLSVMAAVIDGVFKGGSVRSTYQLYVTEDVDSEYTIEEFNWLFAAEHADSAGVSIINSSLGYYDFDDPTMNYAKSDMDGKTTIISKAASMAADRGIVVVVSAGNEGNNAWQTIVAPADVEHVLTIGGITESGNRVSSSSYGPTADGRIKPDVVALGGSTSIVNAAGELSTLSGTSLAAPLITSLVACIWQRYPYLTAKQIMEAVRESGSLAADPSRYLGYGIPFSERIKNYIEENFVVDPNEKVSLTLYPNPSTGPVFILTSNKALMPRASFSVMNDVGQVCKEGILDFTIHDKGAELDFSDFADGLYVIRIVHNGKVFVRKIAVNR
jgi:serine protease AprX